MRGPLENYARQLLSLVAPDTASAPASSITKEVVPNLIDCFGEALKIRIALRWGMPIAAILTLRYTDTLVYKYGCSDARFHPLSGMQLLFWRSIQEAKRDWLRTFDLGRSE